MCTAGAVGCAHEVKACAAAAAAVAGWAGRLTFEAPKKAWAALVNRSFSARSALTSARHWSAAAFQLASSMCTGFSWDWDSAAAAATTTTA